ncbi:hypothetical protein OsI_29879 [Oryza sativa Indica Group]|uniref:BTB domain-containing protein n=1 Tax=Oryza sativa subsp. indica TaxID=39946 RepID=A2YX18_ORYSI|nr:hypothetical protein OsI_29879 [Oryza sativa Indica Group]
MTREERWGGEISLEMKKRSSGGGGGWGVRMASSARCRRRARGLGDGAAAIHMCRVDHLNGSDVFFFVGGETFHAHRALLAVCSPVFKALLLSSTAEAAACSITLNDIKPAMFEALLHFMVVLTSSSSTVRLKDEADLPPNVLLDETSWSSMEFCESLQIWYAIAKTLAEKAAWEFAKENGIDLVAVLPTFVVGPNLSHELSPTTTDVLGLFQGETTKFTMYGRMGYVHIDDVASCHILLYETPRAAGSLPCVYGEQTYGFSTAKVRELGMKFRDLEEMFDDAVDSLRAHGYLLNSVP